MNVGKSKVMRCSWYVNVVGENGKGGYIQNE